MISIYIAEAAKPSVAKNHLLFAVLDLNGIEYRVTRDPEMVAVSDLVITDCFCMETPLYHDLSDHNLCNQLIQKCAEYKKNIVFYYPSESRSTLDASFNPTGEVLSQYGVSGYLIKNGDGQSVGFRKSYNIQEYFAWQITTEFNLARITQTQENIDTAIKTKKFLYLNGEDRPHRSELFELIQTSGILDQALWSNRKTKNYTDIPGPDVDWSNLEIHRDFKFDAYFPEHYTVTEFSVVSETTPAEYFPTEKTFKPLLLGHPFLVAGSQFFLRNLRDMGFKTFNSVIDESYDLLEWYTPRIRAMVTELVGLTNSPCILDETKTIREHNRTHIYTVANRCYKHLLDVLTDIAPIKVNKTLPKLTTNIFENYIRT